MVDLGGRKGECPGFENAERPDVRAARPKSVALSRIPSAGLFRRILGPRILGCPHPAYNLLKGEEVLATVKLNLLSMTPADPYKISIG